MSVQVIGVESPVARVTHRCQLCNRTIEPGERYNRQRIVGDFGPYVFKACAHCDALTTVSTVLDQFEWRADGYAEDDFYEWEPTSIGEARWRAQYRRKWRRRDGALYPVPTTTEADR